MAIPSENPVIALTENVALLSLLHSVSKSGPLQSVPAAPSSNKIDYLAYGQDYILPFDREVSLVGALAFIAQSEEDPNHVPAVCVEQVLEPGILIVLFAVNKSKWSDGSSILHDMKQRFDEIFSILPRISAKRKTGLNIERELFARIISMCSSRILQRLRLVPNNRKQKTKKPIKEVLQNVMAHVKLLGAGQVAEKNLQSTQSMFITRTTEVISLIDSWCGHQTVSRLGDLVQGIYHLHHVAELSNLFGLIPALYMEQRAKMGLLNTIGKVARYREAARIIYRTAKKAPLVRHWKAVPVELPEEAFCFTSPTTYTPNLMSTIARIDPKYHQPKSFNRVCHMLGTSEKEAADQFSRQVNRTLKEAKIHAEVQLVTYCELQRPRLFPRVICSSKDACFLCSSFLLLYKKIHIPKCHGRLYPGWRLPSLPQVKEMEQRFQQRVEDSVKNSLFTLSVRRQKTKYPCPNESTLLTVPVSETTKCSSVQHEPDRVNTQLPFPKISGRSNQPEFTITNGSRKSTKSADMAGTILRSIPGITAVDGTRHSESLTLPESRDQSNEAVNEQLDLSQGDVLRGCVNPGGKSPLYITSSLRIEIEYIVGSKDIEYSVEWLTSEDMKKLQEIQHPRSLFNAEALVGEVSVSNQRSLYIKAKGTNLRLDWQAKTI